MVTIAVTLMTRTVNSWLGRKISDAITMILSKETK